MIIETWNEVLISLPRLIVWVFFIYNKSEILKTLINEYDAKTTKDAQEMLKVLFASIIQVIITRIYTINLMQSYNILLRKVAKSKFIFHQMTFYRNLYI